MGAMRHTYLIAAFVLVNLAIFGQTVHFDFVDYDDVTYIVNNEHLDGGLTVSNVAWGLQSGYFLNWHPVTWWSYLADFDLYDREPGGYHLTNVLIHILATIALYFALLRMTGRQWASALVAMLFAVHPQHVQSVAWISERKDVLSGLFLALTLLAYDQYTKKASVPWYVVTAILFGLGLMSKSMLVTLPCVLFLLDYWPLKRLDSKDAVRRAALEKVPLLLMSGGAALATLLIQEGGGAAATTERFGLVGRMVNAVNTYGMYLLRTVWPRDLLYFYPLDPDHMPYVGAMVSLAVLVGVTIIAVRMRKFEPAVLVGWLWYLGTLVPVIGILQVGSQASADRYTYIPLIGVFIAVVYPIAARVPKEGANPKIAGVAMAIVLAICATLSFFETQDWRNTDTLTRDALEVDPDHYLALFMRGQMLDKQGDSEGAEALVRRSVEVTPRNMRAQMKLGVIERDRDNIAAAMEHFSEGLDAHPKSQLDAHLALGATQYELEDFEAAIRHFNAALALDPENLDAHVGISQILLDTGARDDALQRLQLCLEVDPESYEVLYNLGRLASRSGQVEEARRYYLRAFAANPEGVENLQNLANLQAQTGRLASALLLYARAERARPELASIHVNRAAALFAHDRLPEALESVGRALELDPGHEVGRRLESAIRSEMDAGG